MVQLHTVALLGLAASVQAVPLTKRIAQTIADSTAKWEQACLAAGGGQQCNPLSITAFTTLLAAAGPCEQQDAADKMVALGKQLNSQDVIRFSQIFAQQPRNSPNSVSIPYCQKAPQNAELNGLFQCQFAGDDKTNFVGGVKVGGQGTIPFGLNAPVNPAGSCPAHPDGPIPDGQQLVDLVQTPGTPNTGGGGNGGNDGNTGANDGGNNGNTGANDGSNDNGGAVPSATSSDTPAPSTTADPAPTATDGTGGGSGDLRLSNGQDAQALNKKFASLTADSTCNAGDNACINGGFAQCVGGKFVIQSCGSSLICAALPLVNSRGTSITCTTQADAAARIAATGATGGITGDGDGSGVPQPSQPDQLASTGGTTNSSPGGFQLQNGKDAQALNAKFNGLTPSSSCTDGENACVDGGFAQCVGGKFVVTPCAATLTCAALPLINKSGTSITCTTQADALARIQRTGATGGISG